MQIEPVTEDDYDLFQTSFKLVYGDSYRLFPIDLLEGPRVWYDQLPDERKFKQDGWVEAFSYVQSFVLGDGLWDGPAFTLSHLPGEYNRSGHHLPEMSVMVKGARLKARRSCPSSSSTTC